MPLVLYPGRMIINQSVLSIRLLLWLCPPHSHCINGYYYNWSRPQYASPDSSYPACGASLHVSPPIHCGGCCYPPTSSYRNRNIICGTCTVHYSRAADTVILVRAQSLHGTKKDSCSPRIHRLKAVTHLGSTLYALWDVTALCNPCEWVLLSRNLQKKDFNLFELRARGLPTSTFGIRLWHLTT